MDSQLPKPFIISISLIQGIILTLLYRSIEHQFWPGTDPMWLTALVTFAISFPLLVLLCVTSNNVKETIKYLLPFSLLLSLLAGYVGLQQEPAEYVRNSGVIFTFVLTALIASFKALMYLQQYISKEVISYSSLFTLSWRNFVTFLVSWLFVGIFWGILHLGAGLFSVLEIDFFKKLLRKDWFVIPVLNLAFGFAIFVFRNIIHTVDHISTVLQTLIKFLLPVLCIISLGFLVTLPFTGLGTLWKTGSGSLLVLWLQALTLFFLNTTFQDEPNVRPYKKFIHRLIFISVALLPIYSVIAAYGIGLRIEQYGFTVDRCWAILIWFLLACFSFGYLFSIVKKRDAWLEYLSKVNIAMGVVVLIVMLLVNSPLLNFQSISANSQIARLADGSVNYETFDYRYFSRSLGRQGYLAMEKLKIELEDKAPEKIAVIDRMYINHTFNQTEDATLVEFKKLVHFWPSEEYLPTDLVDAVFAKETQYSWSRYRSNSYYFVAKDLSNDGELEYIVITETNHSTSAHLWRKREDKWHSNYMTTKNPNSTHYLKKYLMQNEVSVVKPKWNDLKVGELTFKVN